MIDNLACTIYTPAKKIEESVRIENITGSRQRNGIKPKKMLTDIEQSLPTYEF